MPPPTHLNPAVAQRPEAPATPPHTDIAFNQDDPKIKQDVAAFIEAAGGSGAAAKERVEIKPDETVGGVSPYDSMLTEALVDTKTVDVTDEERSLFVKSLLTEEPLRLTIKLFNDVFQVQMRSRTVHEQRRVFDVLNKDTGKGGSIDPNDVAYIITRQQQYCMALMIERVNDILFSETKLTPGDTVDTAQATLHAAIEPKIIPMQGLKWTALLNAMRIFETKCAKLGTEAANQDFWKPRG